MDGRVRELERLAAQGDVGAGDRLLRVRLRSGQLPPASVALAAYLGHEGAEAALEGAPRAPADLEAWVAGLAEWGQEVLVRAGVALAWRLLDARRGLPSGPSEATLRALRAAETWCLEPDDPALPPWWVQENAKAAAVLADGVDQDLGWVVSEVVSAAGGRALGDARDHTLEALRLARRRLLNEESVRRSIREALLPWVLRDGDPIRDR